MHIEHFKATLDLTKRMALVGLHNQSIYGTIHETHEQSCKSPHCFIGWAAVLARKEGSGGFGHVPIIPLAMGYLDITAQEEEWLMMPSNTLDDFEQFLAANGIPEGRERFFPEEDGEQQCFDDDSRDHDSI